MTQTLELSFQNAEGKTQKITLKTAADGLTEAQIRPAMETIASLAIFEKEGVNLYEGLKGARYIQRTVTDIF